MLSTQPHTAKLKPIFVYGLLAVLILTVMAGTTPVYARNQTPENLCRISMGEWNPGNQTCTITKENFLKKFSLPRWILYVGKYCGGSDSTTIVLKYKENLEAYAISCGPLSQDNSRASLRSQGKCKLASLDTTSAYGVEHQVTATFIGYPSYLRLKADNSYFRLPVVPGSIAYAGGNKWTANFDTANLFSGSSLAPSGDYHVICVGPSGTAGGRANFNLTP